MSRIDNLEQRIADLEKNVGSAMGELGLVTVSTRKGSDNYREGLNSRIKMIYSGALNNQPTSVDMLKGEIRGLQIANDMLETENKQLKKMIEDLVKMKP